ncbi:MAG TPA: zinc-ribbon domain containing protein [Terracidiphilus sp.]
MHEVISNFTGVRFTSSDSPNQQLCCEERCLMQMADSLSDLELNDKVLQCADCGADFVFTAGEQAFFRLKQFKNDPKRCQPCKAKRASHGFKAHAETQVTCSSCGRVTTVPFKPTQGRPVQCRACFDLSRSAAVTAPMRVQGASPQA